VKTTSFVCKMTLDERRKVRATTTSKIPETSKFRWFAVLRPICGLRLICCRFVIVTRAVSSIMAAARARDDVIGFEAAFTFS